MDMLALSPGIDIAQQIDGGQAGPVVFVAVFHIRPEDEAQLLRAWYGEEPFLLQQPGFVSRELVRGRSGSDVFIDYAKWDCAAAYQAALVHPDHMELLQAYPSGPGSCALHLLDPTREPLGLPASVNRFIQVVNRGDEAAMLEFFDKQSGVVVDDGRRFVGHTAIAAWSAVEFLGAKGRLSPESLSQEGTTVTVLGHWKSAAYTGPTRFVFVCDGARFRELHLGQ
jgi:heme-degrading monooxygenase HmoA